MWLRLRPGVLLLPVVCAMLCRVRPCNGATCLSTGYTMGTCSSGKYCQYCYPGRRRCHVACKACANTKCAAGHARKGQCPNTEARAPVDGYYCEAPGNIKCNPPTFYDASKNKYGCQACPGLECAADEYLLGMCGFTRNDAACTCRLLKKKKLLAPPQLPPTVAAGHASAVGVARVHALLRDRGANASIGACSAPADERLN